MQFFHGELKVKPDLHVAVKQQQIYRYDPAEDNQADDATCRMRWRFANLR